jgi:hypothetical protein
MSNWCWGEWGFKFSILKNAIKKLPWVNWKELDKVYNEIELWPCKEHDDDFEKGGGIKNYLKAKKKLAIKVIKLLQRNLWRIFWKTFITKKSRILFMILTTPIWRGLIFVLIFWWTTLFWFKYFNWKSWRKQK